MARKKIQPEHFPSDCARIVADAVQGFQGQSNELESAIGMLYMGHVFGWKVIYTVHSVQTVKKYEGILGIVVRERYPEHTEHSDRSMGYRVSKSLTNFWRVVRGQVQVEGSRDKAIIV